MSSSSLASRERLGKALRERYLADLSRAMLEIGDAVQERWTELVSEVCVAREAQLRRDAWTAFRIAQPLWVERTLKEWRACLEPVQEKQTAELQDFAGLELVGTDVMENKIMASRMVLAVNDKVIGELDDLRVRIKHMEGLKDLDHRDLLRPEVLVLLMVEQWPHSGMSPDFWGRVSDVVQSILIDRMKQAYKLANTTLIEHGILPVIGLKDRVGAPSGMAGTARRSPTQSVPAAAQESDDRGHARQGGYDQPRGLPAPSSGSFFASGSTSFWKQPTQAGHSGPGQVHSVAEETRLLTAGTPLERARHRAQGVAAQIKRIFVAGTGTDFSATQFYRPSPALREAISQHAAAAHYVAGGTLYQDYSAAGVARVAVDLRDKTVELKKKAESKSEKATIEIVALMFQAILAEERIPPGIRVWFARLQMPVLRVALGDVDFLGSADHPARLLMDRMGSSVMGLDGTGVQGSAMEAEVKRIVQVVEQYPETGKKVYKIVYEEFQRFLAKFLSETQATQKVVSVAQQVEQKETLAIQYTIEMRDMLNDMPVRDEIRHFLFKVWAEVMAVSALRKGARHEDTLLLKKSATDLIWAASAKPGRAERARVIQDLPNLLLRLRSGMTLLALTPDEQDAHVKTISDTLADAFLSKTQAIPQAKIDAMAERLGNLENFVSDDIMGDLPLDSESLEMMLGIDASSIEVVSGGGSKPSAAMLAWASELQLGSWFMLDHQAHITQVQLVWRSERKHLNLFAATNGKSFLIQAGRMAAYLQAGLLLPQEEEALTVRATRDALAKLEADPERLLA